MTKKPRPPRPVPVLTDEQEAYLSAITDSGQFTLAAVLARYPDTLQPITDEQYAVLEKASPRVHGKVISSLLDMTEIDQEIGAKNAHKT